MEQKAAKTNLLAELTKRKMDAQKAGLGSESFKKFQPNRSRNAKASAVGPSRGGRNPQGK